jgi:2'-5' RNA ligase
MSRLVIVLPLSPLRVGASFAVASWPLHITLVPPFLTDADPTDVAAAIEKATVGQNALGVIVGHDELFGRRHDIPVSLVEDDPELTALHRTLKAAMRQFAASPEEPAFTGPGFRAHVTVKDHARVHAGEQLTLTQIALVDMAPRAAASGRTVLAAVPLGSVE